MAVVFGEEKAIGERVLGNEDRALKLELGKGAGEAIGGRRVGRTDKARGGPWHALGQAVGLFNSLGQGGYGGEEEHGWARHIISSPAFTTTPVPKHGSDQGRNRQLDLRRQAARAFRTFLGPHSCK